jgi:hypothetical protein
MPLKKILLVTIFNLFSLSVISQEEILATKIEALNTNCDKCLGFDNQKNTYSIKNNVLNKKSDTESYQYNNLSLGIIFKVDFQNPLEIVVFYKNFNTVVLLDNQLNEIRRIDYNLFSYPINIEATSLSSQNQIWIYDSISSKIGLHNVNTGSIKWISTMLENTIVYYESDYTHFYWIDNQYIMYRISIYGTIEKLGIIPNFDFIQLTKDNTCIYKTNNQLYYYNLKSNISNKIAIDEKIISNFFFRDGILSIFTQNEITNYKIILP